MLSFSFFYKSGQLGGSAGFGNKRIGEKNISRGSISRFELCHSKVQVFVRI